MAKREKRRSPSAISEDVEMTPMIDVVFQLLVYFIVTMKPPDVSAHLDVFRPAAGAPPPEEQNEPPKMIQIDIYPGGGYAVNDRSMSLGDLTGVLNKLAAISPTQTVIIKCARDSEHESLINVLDRCAKTGMTNLSVASME